MNRFPFIVILILLFLIPAVQAKSGAKPSGTALREKRLLEAKAMGAEKKISQLKSKNIKGRGLGIASTALSWSFYFSDPDNFTMEDSITDWLVAFGGYIPETSRCDTVGCYEFARKCATKMNYKDPTKVKEIFAGNASAQCILDFFMQPLDEQARQREDANLDQMLSIFTPSIRNLSCSKSGASVEIYRHDKGSYENQMSLGTVNTQELKKGKLKVDNVNLDPTKLRVKVQDVFNYEITFNTQSKAMVECPTLDDGNEDPSCRKVRDAEVSMINRTGIEEGLDQLTFAKNEPNFLRHYNEKMKYTSYPANVVLDTKLYKWRDEKVQIQGLQNRTTYPFDSFRWARQGMALIDFQKNEIQECCFPTLPRKGSCSEYFANRAQAYKSRAEKASPPKGAR